MAAGSNRASNVLFPAACAVVIAAGSLQLYDRVVGRPDSASPVAPTVERVDRQTLNLAHSTISMRGRPEVVLAEFSDFECPFCGLYARDTFNRIEREFVDRGLVAYAFFSFPLEGLHPRALVTSEAAECAGEQRRFWEMRNVLFSNQRAFAREQLIDSAAGLGLNVRDFEACLDGKTQPRIRAQVETGQRLGVGSTPTCFVGRFESPRSVRLLYRILGAQPYPTFEGALQDALRER